MVFGSAVDTIKEARKQVPLLLLMTLEVHTNFVIETCVTCEQQALAKLYITETLGTLTRHRCVWCCTTNPYEVLAQRERKSNYVMQSTPEGGHNTELKVLLVYYNLGTTFKCICHLY